MKYSVSVYWNDEEIVPCYTAFVPDIPYVYVNADTYSEALMGIVHLVSEIEEREKKLSMFRQLIKA